MSKASKQLYRVTEEQLAKLAGQNALNGAVDAFKKAAAIRARGGKPVCYFSEFNGFSVLDDNDSTTFQYHLSLERRARPYPG
jgi:hypothetical protein